MLGLAVIGLASALAIVVATDEDGDGGSANTNIPMSPGMMEPGWMMGSDGMHYYMHAALPEDEHSTMVDHMQWVRAGSQGSDPVDDATAHRAWDHMMDSGWMAGGRGMVRPEDQMSAYGGDFLSEADFSLMYAHMQWSWSGRQEADPLDDATAHRVWDGMMAGMNRGQ